MYTHVLYIEEANNKNAQINAHKIRIYDIYHYKYTLKYNKRFTRF